MICEGMTFIAGIVGLCVLAASGVLTASVCFRVLFPWFSVGIYA